MTATHTFKVGDKVTITDKRLVYDVRGVIGEFLWVTAADTINMVPVTVYARHCTPHTPPPVRTRWTVETERRFAQDRDQYIYNGVIGTAQGYMQVQQVDVIVAVTRQDGDQ